MRVFTRIVEANSFSRAADTLSLPRASVTNTIQNLEAHLKTRLLQRTTRRLSLTPDGAAYYERCVRILAEVEDAESAFSISSKVPHGRLRIDMPGALGRIIVIPELFNFQAHYPDVEIALGFSDRPVDLIQAGVDCAIRVGALEDSSLIARRIGLLRCVTVAAPRYLASHGVPQTLDALQKHTAVKYFTCQSGRAVDFDFVVGARPVQLTMPGMVAVNDAQAYLNCGVNGLGIVQVPLIIAQSHLEAGELVEVLPAFKPLPQPISAVYPHRLHLSPKVRIFVDWIAAIFARCHACGNETGRQEPSIQMEPRTSESVSHSSPTEPKLQCLSA